MPHFLPEKSLLLNKNNFSPALPLRFVYVGRLSLEKGIKKLVQIWLDLNIPYHLEIFGSGPEKKDIENLAAKSHGRIICRGFLPREEIAREYGRFCATIAPSVCYETFGLSVLESLAAGVPVVVNDLGGLKEFSQKSSAVLGFSLDKPETLLPVLKKTPTSQLREEAMRFVRNYPTMENYYQNLISVYKRLL